MWRNTLGTVLAVLAAAAAIISVFFHWYGSRDGRLYKLTHLFTSDGITRANANLLTGLFLVMLVAAAVTLLGVLLMSRWLVALAGLIVLGFTILWMVRQYQVSDTLTVGDGNLKFPAVLALISGAVLWLASALMPGRRAARQLAAGQGRHQARHRRTSGPAPAPEARAARPEDTVRPGAWQHPPDESDSTPGNAPDDRPADGAERGHGGYHEGYEERYGPERTGEQRDRDAQDEHDARTDRDEGPGEEHRGRDAA
ncbi:hypothetical protein [Streptomyces avicenniae]|uniref:hypothetical protein n=1 Tax=Streptomyces avicenniae TaxID=500153 RepID=UPI00069981A1|nr:hypothetical protein [Streptomyces avicenniae]